MTGPALGVVLLILLTSAGALKSLPDAGDAGPPIVYPEDPPGPPTNLVATAGDGFVELGWNAPTFDGGFPITNYRILRGISSEYLVQIAELGPVLAYNDSAVVNGVTYYYRVIAVNQDGGGFPSLEAVATPTSSGGNGNTAPFASFTLNTLSGDTTTIFMVDASGSSDAEDPVESIEVWWDWEDDGVWDTPWTTVKTAEHQYDAPGTYTIHLEVRDTQLVTASSKQAVQVSEPLADTTAPTISITSPAEDAVLMSATVTIMGTASDDVALETVEVSVDGLNWLAASGTTSWSASVTLTEGDSTIRVRATDTSGNVATETVSVTVDLSAGGQPLDVIPGGLLTVGIVVALVAAVLLVFFLLRGSGSRPPPE